MHFFDGHQAGRITDALAAGAPAARAAVVPLSFFFASFAPPSEYPDFQE